uniref:Uncharacterized protein n=1 Tax=Arundo donax TaxID=35708 RepID=A0A0A9C4D8_ARUDO
MFVQVCVQGQHRRCVAGCSPGKRWSVAVHEPQVFSVAGLQCSVVAMGPTSG